MFFNAAPFSVIYQTIKQKGRRTASDLLSLDQIDINAMGRILKMSPRECAESGIDFYLGSGTVRQQACHRELRYCPECAKTGFHSPIFQIRFLMKCPAHDIDLLDRCPDCRQIIELNAKNLSDRGRSCPHVRVCGNGGRVQNQILPTHIDYFSEAVSWIRKAFLKENLADMTVFTGLHFEAIPRAWIRLVPSLDPLPHCIRLQSQESMSVCKFSDEISSKTLEYEIIQTYKAIARRIWRKVLSPTDRKRIFAHTKMAYLGTSTTGPYSWDADILRPIDAAYFSWKIFWESPRLPGDVLGQYADERNWRKNLIENQAPSCMRFSMLSGRPLTIRDGNWMYVLALIFLATWRKALCKATRSIQTLSPHRLTCSYLGMRKFVDESDEIYGKNDTLSIVFHHNNSRK